MNLIQEGYDRSVYYVDGKVRKVHHTEEGYQQSLLEQRLWWEMPRKFQKHFNRVHLVKDEYSECDYCPTRYEDDHSHLYDADLCALEYDMLGEAESMLPYVEDGDELYEYLRGHSIDFDELLKMSNFVDSSEIMIFVSYGKTI